MRPTIKVVLVEPLGEANIGACARLVKNFGAHELVIVNPPVLGEQAQMFAMHARDVLQQAKLCQSLRDAIQGCTLVVGTTGRMPKGDHEHYRFPLYDVRELHTLIEGSNIALVFGRESSGLTNEELELCDVVVTIPTSPKYPSLNLSHAVAIVLYELSKLTGGVHDLSTVEHREGLIEHLEELLVAVGYPQHKRKKTLRMTRKLLGRAQPTIREVFTLRGIIRRTMWALKMKRGDA